MEYTIEELEYLAKCACIDIYDDYDPREIEQLSVSIQMAYLYGEKLKELEGA